GGKQAQAGSQGEGFRSVADVGKFSPMGQELVAVRLQRIGEAFVEVDAGELSAAQEREGGGGVAFADCVCQRGEVEGFVLAPGSGEVGAAGGDSIGTGEDAAEDVAGFDGGELVG